MTRFDRRIRTASPRRGGSTLSAAAHWLADAMEQVDGYTVLLLIFLSLFSYFSIVELSSAPPSPYTGPLI